MAEQLLQHMHKDVEQLKRDMSVIKHILTEEGKLKPEARRLLEEARSTPDKEYITHESLKKQILS